MSESNSDHSANSAPGEGAGPLPHAGLPARSEPAPLTATRSTALVLAVPRTEEAATGPGPESARRAAKSRRFAFTPAAASIVAMLVGSAIGSAATAGLIYLNAAPDDPTTSIASFDRINRESATLKASINGAAEQSTSQIRCSGRCRRGHGFAPVQYGRYASGGSGRPHRRTLRTEAGSAGAA
jgi:hypothetical protein